MKILSLLCLASLLVGAFAGCASDRPPSTTTTTTTEETTSVHPASQQ